MAVPRTGYIRCSAWSSGRMITSPIATMKSLLDSRFVDNSLPLPSEQTCATGPRSRTRTTSRRRRERGGRLQTHTRTIQSLLSRHCHVLSPIGHASFSWGEETVVCDSNYKVRTGRHHKKSGPTERQPEKDSRRSGQCGGCNLYDAKYIEYFTGLNRWLPSFAPVKHVRAANNDVRAPFARRRQRR